MPYDIRIIYSSSHFCTNAHAMDVYTRHDVVTHLTSFDIMLYLQSVGDIVKALLQVLHRPVGDTLIPVFHHGPPKVVLESHAHKMVRLQLRPSSVLTSHIISNQTKSRHIMPHHDDIRRYSAQHPEQTITTTSGGTAGVWRYIQRTTSRQITTTSGGTACNIPNR